MALEEVHDFPAPEFKLVPLSSMKVSPTAQRNFDDKQAASYAADFKPEAFGLPVVNLREGEHWIVDGQHRIEAAKLVGWGVTMPGGHEDDLGVVCETYDGLSEGREAELFLSRDTRRKIHPLDKFRIAVVAERPREVEIQEIVHSVGLHVAHTYSGVGAGGGIGAVAVLHRLHDKGGHNLLTQTLAVVKDSFGAPGMRGPVIEGVGLVLHRFGAVIDNDRMVDRLSHMMGGVTGLLGKAQTVKLQTGSTKANCVASVVARTYNAYGNTRSEKQGNFPGRLPNWWKQTEYDV